MLPELIAAIVAVAPIQDAAPPATPGTAQQRSILDDLIERTHAIKSLRARWRITSSDVEAPGSIDIEYRAPDAIRVDIHLGERVVTGWFRDGVVQFRGFDGVERFHSTIDPEAGRAERAVVEEALLRAIPYARPFELEPRTDASIHLQWTYDASSEACGLAMAPRWRMHDETPFGWLEKLRDLECDPTRTGEQLRFVVDEGRCEILVASTTGMLESVMYRAGKNHVSLKLEADAYDAPLDPLRLELPTDPPEGVDRGAEGREAREHDEAWDLREHVYAMIVMFEDDGEWDAELTGRVEEVLRRLHELLLRRWLSEWSARMVEHIDEYVVWSDQMKERSAPAEEIEEGLRPGREWLTTELDTAAASYVDGLTSPIDVHQWRCASILAMERVVAARVFEERHRLPLLERFARAEPIERK